ncbi:MAG: hypothetical protein DMG16_07010 [Acidobacteria bacterium]|nr:MAG: hypothetical protein DMG16_07010 [Acidobacteriota bacterium]
MILVGSLWASAQSVRIDLEPVIASGLNQPLYLTNAHDRTGRRFVVEQPGRISVMQPGSSTRTTFLDITGRVLSGGERGLLGLAFHPQFASNRRFFVDYTRRPDGATVIAEYHVSTSNPNVAQASETVLLLIPQPYENHNGGMIEFGPDGYLYIGMGDGGSGNDPENRAQNPNELLGKILRIDVDRGAPPPTNPYADGLAGRREIYAIGLRNPWRFSFDRATGQLYVGDVGQNQREEVDIVTAGGNYGWRVFEGTRCTNLGPASCSTPGFLPPITEYDHSTNGRCSITGGYVYRGTQQSLPYGAYVYGDYCSGEIFMLEAGVQSVLIHTTLSITSFGEDESGELYVVGQRGSVFRIKNPDADTGSTRGFGFADHGSFSMRTAGQSNLVLGYARIQASSGASLPAGMAVFGYRQNGILVSEASAPLMPLISSGRIDAVDTAVAITNPNTEAVTLNFYFTDAAGNNFGQGSTILPPNSGVAAFLDQPPFSAPRGSVATFTFTSTLLVSALALRGITNERGDFLMTILPVVDISNSPDSFSLPAPVQTIAQFVDGGGWATEIVLINPLNRAISGSIQAFNPAGQPASVQFAGPYTIPPGGLWRFRTLGTGANVQSGSIRITPSADSPAPSSTAILSFRNNGITVLQTAIAGVASGTAFRLFVENVGTFNSLPGSIQTAIAVANPTSNPASVALELYGSDGATVGLGDPIAIPANGQIAVFLNQIPGFSSLSSSFQGVLRVSSASTVAVSALRAHYNERGDFLISPTLPVSEADLPHSSELLFPHLAIGSGCEMQFVLFSGRATSSSGTIYFFDQNGTPLSLALRQ